jgi:hypothetical protein
MRILYKRNRIPRIYYNARIYRNRPEETYHGKRIKGAKNYKGSLVISRIPELLLTLYERIL